MHLGPTATTYFAAIATASFGLVIFGAGLIGSRLIAISERIAVIRREMADLLNDLSSPDRLLASWKHKSREEELADTFELTRSVRRRLRLPIGLALVTGIASLLPFTGFQSPSMIFRTALLLSLAVASLAWVSMVWKLSTGILLQTRADYVRRAEARKKAIQDGQPPLLSGDPDHMKAVLAAIVSPVRPSWRHPVKAWKWHRWLSTPTRPEV